MNKYTKWLIILILIALVILLARGGATLLATIIGAIVALAPILEKVVTEKQKNKMTIDEAKEILGIQGELNEKIIKEAHMKLIKKNHPDQGGSDYLASKINQARDMLLDYIKTHA